MFKRLGGTGAAVTVKVDGKPIHARAAVEWMLGEEVGAAAREMAAA